MPISIIILSQSAVSLVKKKNFKNAGDFASDRFWKLQILSVSLSKFPLKVATVNPVDFVRSHEGSISNLQLQHNLVNTVMLGRDEHDVSGVMAQPVIKIVTVWIGHLDVIQSSSDVDRPTWYTSSLKEWQKGSNSLIYQGSEDFKPFRHFWTQMIPTWKLQAISASFYTDKSYSIGGVEDKWCRRNIEALEGHSTS